MSLHKDAKRFISFLGSKCFMIQTMQVVVRYQYYINLLDDYSMSSPLMRWPASIVEHFFHTKVAPSTLKIRRCTGCSEFVSSKGCSGSDYL